MKLTENQQRVLDELKRIGRENAFKWRGREPHLHHNDLEQLKRGDQASAFGMGGLTYQVGHSVGMKPGAVLSIFKALERKGLALRENRNPEYQRPLYWWPVGLAAELLAELNPTTQETSDDAAGDALPDPLTIGGIKVVIDETLPPGSWRISGQKEAEQE